MSPKPMSSHMQRNSRMSSAVSLVLSYFLKTASRPEPVILDDKLKVDMKNSCLETRPSPLTSVISNSLLSSSPLRRLTNFLGSVCTNSSKLRTPLRSLSALSNTLARLRTRLRVSCADVSKCPRRRCVSSTLACINSFLPRAYLGRNYLKQSASVQRDEFSRPFPSFGSVRMHAAQSLE